MAVSATTEREHHIRANGTVEIIDRTVYADDGVPIGERRHRTVLAPGDDVTNADARTAAITSATWTPDVLTAYAAQVKADVAAVNALDTAAGTTPATPATPETPS